MTQQQAQLVFFLAFALFWLVAAVWMLEWRAKHIDEEGRWRL
jgi:hypothetical protein